jgi:hypothetical protein
MRANAPGGGYLVGYYHRWTRRIQEKTMPNTRTNELLGYPPDARLLILNADDFG